MKQLPFWAQLLVIAILLPAAFWLRFGRVDAFALGFTAFLLLLALAVHYLPGLADRYGADQAQHPVAPGRLDWLAPVWLLCIPFAPLVLWLIGSLAVVTEANWRLVLGSKAFVCVVLPVISVLPLLKYVRGQAAPISMLILAIGTLFPVTFGLNALWDLSSGPQREQVVVAHVRQVQAYVSGRSVATDIVEVELGDGRTLQADQGVGPIVAGPAWLTVLRSTGTILSVHPE